MDSSTLLATLEQAVPGAVFEPAASVDLQTTVFLSSSERVVEIAQILRDRSDLRFAFLAELTAVDFWPREPRFELVYLLVSIEHRLRLRMKVRLPGSDPHVATVSGVWPAANWLEREVWDMFGIAFDGHPDPRRLLMPEDWEGYPLRKDFPVQIRRPAYAGEPLQVSEQEFRDNVQRDRLTRGS
jgi:NADH-quinone oxidoreductase subunit C